MPEVIALDTMPVLMRVIFGLMGSLMIVASVAAIRHGLRLQWFVRKTEPKPVRVSVIEHEGTDTTTYSAIVNFLGSDMTWETPIYHNKAVDKLLDRSAHRLEAWRASESGAPIALRVDGKLIYTYPKATRTHRMVHS